MRNKVLQLIYKTLETPSKQSRFHSENPYNCYYEDEMDFTLNFPDGSPSIYVRARRTSIPSFLCFKWI